MSAVESKPTYTPRLRKGRADSGRNMKNASPEMGNKIRAVLTSGLVAGVLAVVTAGPAAANRGGYVPPRDGNPPVTVPVDLEDQEIEETEDPVTDPSGTGVDVSPAVEVKPGVEEVNPAVQAGADPSIASAGDGVGVAPNGEQAPAAVERPRGGILSKTGADSLALVRAGMAAVTLGAGLVLLGRRRRAAGSAA